MCITAHAVYTPTGGVLAPPAACEAVRLQSSNLYKHDPANLPADGWRRHRATICSAQGRHLPRPLLTVNTVVDGGQPPCQGLHTQTELPRRRSSEGIHTVPVCLSDAGNALHCTLHSHCTAITATAITATAHCTARHCRCTAQPLHCRIHALLRALRLVVALASAAGCSSCCSGVYAAQLVAGVSLWLPFRAGAGVALAFLLLGVPCSGRTRSSSGAL